MLAKIVSERQQKANLEYEKAATEHLAALHAAALAEEYRRAARTIWATAPCEMPE